MSRVGLCLFYHRALLVSFLGRYSFRFLFFVSFLSFFTSFLRGLFASCCFFFPILVSLVRSPRGLRTTQNLLFITYFLFFLLLDFSLLFPPSSCFFCLFTLFSQRVGIGKLLYILNFLAAKEKNYGLFNKFILFTCLVVLFCLSSIVTACSCVLYSYLALPLPVLNNVLAVLGGFYTIFYLYFEYQYQFGSQFSARKSTMCIVTTSTM